MRRHARRDWWLASGLAVLAGYVDAIGFLRLDGLFVSFMSGNSTQLAVRLTTGSAAALAAGGLIVGFVTGVMVGTVAATAAGRWRKPAVIALTAGLLAVATIFGLRGASVALLAAAMGVANCVFLRDGEVSIGVTYMTGTLVKLGQGLAATVTGRGAPWAWVPYLMIWCGLVAGAATGASCFARWGPGAMSGAVALATMLALIAALFGPADPIS